jgi:SAM-dependent methyltransferase
MASGDPPRSIDRGHYETSGYFEGGGTRFLDPESRFQRYRAREVLRLCEPLDGRRVVDLGCGWGTISFATARRAGRVVGVDFADAALQVCRRRLVSDARANLRFVQADAGNTGLQGGAWDLVVAADLVEHLYPEDSLRVYREVHRLLRSGGRFVIWTPNPGHVLERLRALRLLVPDPTHVDYKTLPRLVEELQAAGFAIERARYVPSHVPFLRTLERGMQRFIPLLRRRVAVVAVRGNFT